MTLAIFRVSNFLSIKDTIEISFIPNGDYGLDNSCTAEGFLQLAALYGANSAGKTNILLAFAYLRYLITGNPQTEILQKTVNRLRGNVSCPMNESNITHFEIFFNSAGENISYTLDYDSTSYEVVTEKITSYDSKFGNGDLFIRNQMEYSVQYNLIYESIGEQSVDLLFKNDGLITGTPAVKQVFDKGVFNMPFRKVFCEISLFTLINTMPCVDLFYPHIRVNLKVWAECVIELTDISAISLYEFTSSENEDTIQPLDALCTEGDFELEIPDSCFSGQINLKAIDITNNKKPYIIQFSVESDEHLLSFKDLSTGTQRIIDVLGTILTPAALFITKNKGCYVEEYPQLFIIDEICYAIHPSIVVKLIHKILAVKPRAQFVMTFHETELLTSKDFRRDEIWFVNKKNNETTIESLDEYIDKGADARIGYLNNRYGGIPRFRGGQY